MNHETGGPRALRVLGVDPGTRCVGYGIVELSATQQARLIHCDALRLTSGSPAAKLERIYRHMSAQMETHCPQVLAIEDIFHGKNFRSVLKVGQARGVIILAAQMAGIEISEYSPRLVKKSVTGNGNADKSQVQRMVARILGLKELLEPNDITDAIAVAFCHGRRAWSDNLLGRQTPKIDARNVKKRSLGSKRLEESVRGYGARAGKLKGQAPGGDSDDFRS